MSKLLPYEAIIYEKSNGVIYGRYRDRPDIDRWIVGSNNTGPLLGNRLTYSEWNDLHDLAQQNKTLKKQLEKALMIYYTIKNGK